MAITLGGTSTDPYLAQSFNVLDKEYLSSLEILFKEGVSAQCFIAESSTPWGLLKNLRYLNFGPDEQYIQTGVSVLTHPNCPTDLLEELKDSERIDELTALSLSPNISQIQKKEFEERIAHKNTLLKTNNQSTEVLTESKLLSDYLIFSPGTKLNLKKQILSSGHPFQIFSEFYDENIFAFPENWFQRFQELEVLYQVLWPRMKEIGANFFYWSSSYTGDCLYIDYSKFDFYRGKDQIADRGESSEISIAPSDTPILKWFRHLTTSSPEYVIHNLRTHEEGFFEWVEDWKLAAAISCFSEADNVSVGNVGTAYNSETKDFGFSEDLIRYIAGEFIDFFDSGSDFVTDVEFIDKSSGLLSWESTTEKAQVLIVDQLQKIVDAQEEINTIRAQHFLECIALHPDTKRATLMHMSSINNEFMQMALGTR